jgi:hypothetical protein
MKVNGLMAAAVVAGGMIAAGPVRADTLFIEAEGAGQDGRPLSERFTKITSPFLIKDDGAASLGRYLTVAPGLNSQSSPPPVEGVATYRFNVAAAGSYRIWGRVIVPNANSDSFWVRVRQAGSSSSTLVRWNDIPAGGSWHWAQVIADGSTTPAQFTLQANVDYELQVSYREAGARLDLLVLTSDNGFNPKSPPTTAPPLAPDVFDAPWVVPRRLTAGARTGIKVFWSEVPGAKSYTLTRSTSNGETRTSLPTITGLTGHSFTETTLPTGDGSNCYEVTALFSDGSSRRLPFSNEICEVARYERTFLDTVSTLTGSAPMVVDEQNNGAYTAPGTPGSPNAAPARGRVRLDFSVGGPAALRLWFVVDAPDTGHDSFWARMDDGPWVKWNNIPDGCSPVSNSDAGGAPVTFNVAAGTHRFELATRETGTVGGLQAPRLSNIFFITDNLQATSRLCAD